MANTLPRENRQDDDDFEVDSSAAVTGMPAFPVRKFERNEQPHAFRLRLEALDRKRLTGFAIDPETDFKYLLNQDTAGLDKLAEPGQWFQAMVTRTHFVTRILG